MNRPPLAGLQEPLRRRAVLAVLVALLLLGAVALTAQVTRQESKGDVAGRAPSATVGPNGPGPDGGGSADTQASEPAGRDGTAEPDATTGTAGPGAIGGSNPQAGGAGPGGGGAAELPGVLRAPAAPTGGRVDPPTPVPPRAPVRCASMGAPQTGALPPPDENGGRRWVTVGRLAGNCDRSSEGFRLLGIDTRLAWRSDADSFAVFLVDAVQGREATAGFAEGQCAGSCSESQPIVPTAGDYRLEVQAGDAPWEVEIQEYRRP